MTTPTLRPDLNALEQRFTRLCLHLHAWEAAGDLDDGDAWADQLDRDSTALLLHARALDAERARLIDLLDRAEARSIALHVRNDERCQQVDQLTARVATLEAERDDEHAHWEAAVQEGWQETGRANRAEAERAHWQSEYNDALRVLMDHAKRADAAEARCATLTTALEKIEAEARFRECVFWACDGPEAPYTPVQTCWKCRVVQIARAALADAAPDV